MPIFDRVQTFELNGQGTIVNGQPAGFEEKIIKLCRRPYTLDIVINKILEDIYILVIYKNKLKHSGSGSGSKPKW